MKKVIWVLLLSLLAYSVASADSMVQAVQITHNKNGQEAISFNMQVLLLMTLLTFLPGIIMAMTSFTRIIIVLAILRQAIGLNQTPTNQILIGIAMFLTYYTMAPVLETVYTDAIKPLLKEEITMVEALKRSSVPMKNFMVEHVRKNDIEFFSDLAKTEIDVNNIPLRVLVPAYLTSELKTAFQIGFIIFLPFLMVDIIVASVLMSMGMMMLSPLIISLPFKILLFVLIDGWVLILGTLSSGIINGG